jgi:hypothetical protein
MHPIQAEWADTESGKTISLLALAQHCAMSTAELTELLDYCALAPPSA